MAKKRQREFLDQVYHRLGPAPVHDYTEPNRRWGHNYNIMSPVEGSDALVTVKIAGWGRGLSIGDLMKLTAVAGHEVLYKIAEIRYVDDPSDMFFATIKYQSRV